MDPLFNYLQECVWKAEAEYKRLRFQGKTNLAIMAANDFIKAKKELEMYINRDKNVAKEKK